ncbi:2-oxoacid:acceptor oxidoreductase family protein, partial [candidate division WOR-3 bacterium]|nr:2-oxoacid:acceptor oxidoreductase family protein [candidate division WOR-3 bacterium]
FYVHNVTKDHISIPFFETVKEKLSSTLPLNMVVIAFIAKFTGVVSEESVHESVLKKVPPHTVDLNIQALRLGADIAKRYR